MNVVDSSAWLEYFAHGATASFFAGPIEEIEAVVVPPTSLLEVFKQCFSNVARVQHCKRPRPCIRQLSCTVSAEPWTQDAGFDGIEGVRY